MEDRLMRVPDYDSIRGHSFQGDHSRLKKHWHIFSRKKSKGKSPSGAENPTDMQTPPYLKHFRDKYGSVSAVSTSAIYAELRPSLSYGALYRPPAIHSSVRSVSGRARTMVYPWEAFSGFHDADLETPKRSSVSSDPSGRMPPPGCFCDKPASGSVRSSKSPVKCKCHAAMNSSVRVYSSPNRTPVARHFHPEKVKLYSAKETSSDRVPKPSGEVAFEPMPSHHTASKKPPFTSSQKKFLQALEKSDPINSVTSRKSILECEVTAYDLIKQYLKSSSIPEIEDDLEDDDNLSDIALDDQTPAATSNKSSSSKRVPPVQSKLRSASSEKSLNKLDTDSEMSTRKTKGFSGKSSIRLGGQGMCLFKTTRSPSSSHIDSAKSKTSMSPSGGWTISSAVSDQELYTVPVPDYDDDEESDASYDTTRFKDLKISYSPPPSRKNNLHSKITSSSSSVTKSVSSSQTPRRQEISSRVPVLANGHHQSYRANFNSTRGQNSNNEGNAIKALQGPSDQASSATQDDSWIHNGVASSPTPARNFTSSHSTEPDSANVIVTKVTVHNSENNLLTPEIKSILKKGKGANEPQKEKGFYLPSFKEFKEARKRKHVHFKSKGNELVVEHIGGDSSTDAGEEELQESEISSETTERTGGLSPDTSDEGFASLGNSSTNSSETSSDQILPITPSPSKVTAPVKSDGSGKEAIVVSFGRPKAHPPPPPPPRMKQNESSVNSERTNRNMQAQDSPRKDLKPDEVMFEEFDPDESWRRSHASPNVTFPKNVVPSPAVRVSIVGSTNHSREKSASETGGSQGNFDASSEVKGDNQPEEVQDPKRPPSEGPASVDGDSETTETKEPSSLQESKEDEDNVPEEADDVSKAHERLENGVENAAVTEPSAPGGEEPIYTKEESSGSSESDSYSSLCCEDKSEKVTVEDDREEHKPEDIVIPSADNVPKDADAGSDLLRVDNSNHTTTIDNVISISSKASPGITCTILTRSCRDSTRSSDPGDNSDQETGSTCSSSYRTAPESPHDSEAEPLIVETGLSGRRISDGSASPSSSDLIEGTNTNLVAPDDIVTSNGEDSPVPLTQSEDCHQEVVASEYEYDDIVFLEHDEVQDSKESQALAEDANYEESENLAESRARSEKLSEPESPSVDEPHSPSVSVEDIRSTYEAVDHDYETLKLEPIYEEVPDIPLPPKSEFGNSGFLSFDAPFKSIFEGASKDEILNILEDAKERGVEKLIPEDLKELTEVVNTTEKKNNGRNHRNRISNISNSSDSSNSFEGSTGEIAQDDLSYNKSEESEKDDRPSSADIERNDSGVGAETSKPVKVRRVLRPANEEQQCADCDQQVEPVEDEKSGLLYCPLVCKKCQMKRTERKEIITEIVETELKYGRDLRIIKEEFYRPMEVAGLLTKEQLKGVFLNLEELSSVNAKFSEKLQDALDIAVEQGDEDYTTVNIGKLFLESAAMLHAYESYCVQQSSASLLLTNMEKEKELLRIFLRVSTMENTLLRRMNLPAFLMVPVQRVTKYPLLLNRLYKVTPYHHQDREALKEAQQKVELHLEHINQQTKGVGGTKIWRRISNISVSHRRLANYEDIGNIKLRKMALEVLMWNRDEVRFVLAGKLCFAQVTDYPWNKKGKGLKFVAAHALLITLGKPNSNYHPDLAEDEGLMFPKSTGIRDATLLLIKEKNGRYALLKEPLHLGRCIISCDSENEEMFEIQEFTSKDTYLFKADTPNESKEWLRQLRYHAKDLGLWRKRRNAMANIMINGMMRQ